MTGNTLFSFKSQYLQSWNLHFKTGKKIITAFVFILQEMKAVTKSSSSGVHLVHIESNSSLGVHLEP